jgi:hypothetical protein
VTALSTRNYKRSIISISQSFAYSETDEKVSYTECPKSLEPMGILIIFLIFIYRLKLKVKSLKMALTLDERLCILAISEGTGVCC